MNLPKKILLAATVTAGLLAPAAVSHAGVIVSEIATDSTAFSAPAPTKVVSPTDVPRRYQNAIIRLSLTVDAQGRPHNIAVLSDRDQKLTQCLRSAVSQWEFTPAIKDGRAVAVDVVLPLQVVDGPLS
ncbi:Gram-negative bacterial tonB protein [Lacunisphaera limnophila]|uniref:Gram-negative bacterial tonB protein n=1 Tax=Lacunisphaera limnophila TaxID=1838286 RepID=A0A1D8AUZ5_9BACT|nr:energy transducer TonB [Lacunisphaera limnophila]AOS44702.1 Gram-negative bacterial tonB protein [Lacunisphaera limnophila]